MKYSILSEEQCYIIEDDIWLWTLSEIEYEQYIFSKCFYDIELFSDIFLSHWKVLWDWIHIPFTDFHREMWWMLDGKKNLNVIVPRRHAKTTCIKIYMLHSLLYEKHKSILYISSTWLWEEAIWVIRKELETNELLIRVYANQIPWESKEKQKTSLKWRQKQLQLLNDCSIETVSKWWNIRWRSPTLICADDVQEDKDVENKKIVEKLNSWFFASLYNTLMDWGKIVVVWTIIWELCLVKYLRDEKNWETIEYQAINDWKALWEEMWSLEKLEKRRAEIWEAIFNQEFMNIPLSKENRVIKTERIQKYDRRKFVDEATNWYLVQFDKIIMAIDPAISTKEKADFTWICVTWYLWDNKYVLHSEWVKKPPWELKEYIKSLFNLYYPSLIIVENIAYQDMLRQDLALANLPVMWYRPSKDKFTRLLSVAANIELWKVFFPYEVEELIYQLTHFPDVKHDDELDAFVYTLLWWEWMWMDNYLIK